MNHIITICSNKTNAEILKLSIWKRAITYGWKTNDLQDISRIEAAFQETGIIC